MTLSQKCQYAVRAILELSKRHGKGIVPAGEIASVQEIPQRFLEIILNELKPTGLLTSRRGAHGGYFLRKHPKEITVGEVIRQIEGPLDPVRCTGDKDTPVCPLKGKCSLIELWDEARRAVEAVYDSTSFQDLVDRDSSRKTIPDYDI